MRPMTGKRDSGWVPACCDSTSGFAFLPPSSPVHSLLQLPFDHKPTASLVAGSDGFFVSQKHRCHGKECGGSPYPQRGIVVSSLLILGMHLAFDDEDGKRAEKDISEECCNFLVRRD